LSWHCVIIRWMYVCRTVMDKIWRGENTEVLICYLHPYDDIRLSLEAHIPAGIPVTSRVGSPRGVCPRGVQYAHLEARSVGIYGPGKPNFPVDPRPTYRHRGELPVPHSSLRSSRTARSSGGAPPPPPPDLLRRPRNGKLPLRIRWCPPSLPVPCISLPLLGFLLSSHLLSSPHTVSCRSCKKSRLGEPYGGRKRPDVELRGHFVGMYALPPSPPTRLARSLALAAGYRPAAPGWGESGEGAVSLRDT